MKIGVITYAFARPGDLHRLLDHVLQEPNTYVYLFLHSQIPLVVNTCVTFAMHDRVIYFPYGENRGLGRSANEALYQGYFRDGMDVMMTSNDDLLPGPGDLQKIAEAACCNRDRYLVNGMGVTGGRHENSDISFAAINPIALEKIGYFDVNFTPAYYEDVDHRRRARLAGLQELTVMDTNIQHVGSGSLGYVPKEVHDRQFIANREHYTRKWGGDMGAETFTIPFNNPAFGLCIPYAEMRHPYGAYDREDLAA